MDRAIGSREACNVLGVDRATLFRWGREGRLEIVHKVPGRNGAALWNAKQVEELAAVRAEQVPA